MEMESGRAGSNVPYLDGTLLQKRVPRDPRSSRPRLLKRRLRAHFNRATFTDNENDGTLPEAKASELLPESAVEFAISDEFVSFFAFSLIFLSHF